ncbi:MAG: helix-turn-helix domain-containing protein [bacterium]|nr:helix-turn-helix domain-containing protein [bacterium]
MDYEGRITRIADTERLGQAVRELRRSQKMTQAELAAAAGAPRGRISEIESEGKGGTSVATVLAVLSALGYEIDLCPAPPTGDLAAYAESFAGP